MGSKPKMGAKTAPQTMSYGGTNMTQQAAQEKYQADLAAWRAPTATGTGTADQANPYIASEAPAAVAGGGGAAPTHLGVPTTNWTAMDTGGGPAIPAIGVMPTAPIAVGPQRTTLARYMNPYQGGRGKDGGGGYTTSNPSTGRSSSAMGGKAY